MPTKVTIDTFIKKLRAPEAPYFHIRLSNDPSGRDAAFPFDRIAVFIRTVRGRKMLTLDRLFDEFADACQCFAENWDAFIDCFTDPIYSWNPPVPPGEPILIAITDAHLILSDWPKGPIAPRRRPDLEIFYNILNISVRQAVGTEYSGFPDRICYPLHFLLDTDLDHLPALSAVLEKVGCDYEVVEINDVEEMNS